MTQLRSQVTSGQVDIVRHLRFPRCLLLEDKEKVCGSNLCFLRVRVQGKGHTTTKVTKLRLKMPPAMPPKALSNTCNAAHDSSEGLVQYVHKGSEVSYSPSLNPCLYWGPFPSRWSRC